MLIALTVALAIFGAPKKLSAQGIPPAEAQAIARDAYVYSYAMMESYQTWRAQTVDKTSNGYVGGFNVFRHYSEPFTPDNKDIVHAEQRHALFLGVLDLAPSRWWSAFPRSPRTAINVMQWIDFVHENFAYIGVRSTASARVAT